MSLFEELSGLVKTLFEKKGEIDRLERDLTESNPPITRQDSLSESDYGNAVFYQNQYIEKIEKLKVDIKSFKDSYNSAHASLLTKIELDNQWLKLNPRLRIKKSNSTIEVFQGDQNNFKSWQNNANTTHKIFEQDHYVFKPK